MRVMPWPETSVVKQRHEFVLRALEDGRLPLDNNISERALRREAVGRKNWLFVGSDDGARVVARDLPHELGERREVEALDPRAAGEDDDRRGPPLILPLDDDDGRERDTRSRLLDPAVERAPVDPELGGEIFETPRVAVGEDVVDRLSAKVVADPAAARRATRRDRRERARRRETLWDRGHR